MLTLLIDTHSLVINLVLYQNKKVLDKINYSTNKSHSIYIMPLIVKLLAQNNIDKNEIKEIIVANGPGSFTGSRLGITIAKTWAYTKKIPIKVISSLEVLACSIPKKQVKVAIPDAKGYYLGEFQDNKKIKEFTYVNGQISQDYELEENINIDYNKVYEYTQNLQAQNPHSVKPIYIKKIGVENDSAR